MRRLRSLRDNSGATALEFALISPALILTLVGGFQLAWALHCAATVRWSLETCARSLVFNPSEAQDTLKAAMLSAMSGRASPTASQLTVTITQDTSNAASTMLVATSTYNTTLSVPFLPSEPLTFTSVTRVPSP